MSEGHTKTPWTVKKHGGRYRVVDVAQQMTIAHVQIEYMNAAAANASLIVTAVNSHSALMKCAEALRKVIDATSSYLPPDGISREELITRVFEATDNKEIVEALSLLDEVSK